MEKRIALSTRRPLIGCATYRKTIDQTPPIEVYGLMPAYTEAVRAAGGVPILLPLGLDDDELSIILERVDGLLLPGGGDIGPHNYAGDDRHPTIRDVDDVRDWTELWLVHEALAREKPMLAICRGIQVFNVALGGALWEDVHSQMPDALVHDYFHKQQRDYLAHTVDVLPDSLLAQTLQAERVRVNSLHHQGIRRLAPELRSVATAPDGLIEAVEVPGHRFALGVQWHPENLLEVAPAMLSLFRGLVDASTNGLGNGHR